MPSIALTGHPANSCERIRRFTVQENRIAGGLLSLQYLIESDLTGVRLPGPYPPRRTVDSGGTPAARRFWRGMVGL